MRRAVRAIVIKNDSMLVMHRNKFGHQYYCLVGGGVDAGETEEQALIREIHEEASLEVANLRLVYIEEAGKPYGNQYIYLCDYVSGEPVLWEGSDEAKIHKLGQNLYSPGWLPLTDLEKVPFLSVELQHHLLEGLSRGFPEQPVTFSSTATISTKSEES